MNGKKKIAVIGLGHFGYRLCADLSEIGVEVLAIDINEKKVERLRDIVKHTVILDSRDEIALSGIDIDNYDHVVVAIGEDIEASLITIALLQKLKAKSIIGRACSETQEIILKQMKIDHIFLPEGDAARQMARKLYLKGADNSFNISAKYILVEAKPPEWTVNKKIGNLHLISEYGVNIITLLYKKSTDELLSIGKRKKIDIEGIVSSDTVINEDCELLLFGKEENIARFLNENV